MLEGIYAALDELFGPLVMNTHPMLVVTVAGIILGAFFVLLNYFLVDQEKVKRLQKMSMEFQKEFREAREKGDEKKLRKLQQKQLELIKLQNEVMKDAFFKPMLITWPIIIVFWGWLRRWYFEVAIVKYPFNFFLFDIFHKIYHSALQADELGYLGWYFLTSYVVGSVLRKFLDMA
ncbi:EMC3/TMCO1 family protein [Pyrococcus yayanosii]|uniref:DUF106 domain-containing protein n=1 Tax=Pyrococcus yayanosii (strain CH1 / JCM 16557) TaxID=529709 RepID=F8AFW8_PYRYC|nr:DUF106 domain-containing protein [Pyrococcus yayanosii]AEH23872.1 hypothetical protein PYCH_01630 [Pyrococcus yayanosii CH1]